MIDFKIIRSIVAEGLCHTTDCGHCEEFFNVDGCPIHDCDEDVKIALLKKLYDRALFDLESGDVSWSEEEFMEILNSD